MQWDKNYHTLMPPFVIAGVLLMVFLPAVFRPYIILIVPLIFWTIYHIWKKRDEHKTYLK